MHDDKSCQLRTLLREKRLIRLVGAHNGMTARLVEQSGFDGVWASGLEVSTAHAVPDANILTMKDYLDAAINMNDATSLPVVADVDTGYGNANNVIHAVQKFEFAGIAAICIEDKTFPKVNSYVPGRQHLAPISEVVGKIMAGRTNREVLVRGDQNVQYGKVVHLMSVLQQAGATNVGLITEAQDTDEAGG